MSRRSFPLAFLMLLLISVRAFLVFGTPQDSVDEVTEITRSLAPALADHDQVGNLFSLEERMDYYEVPGISIAVIEGGEIDWAKGFGKINSADHTPVSDTTLFQAASISKPVAATAALQFIQDGLLSLDSDINEYLKNWKLSWNTQNREQPVTLRHILSHTGGLSVHGFPGYAADTPTPELNEILDGTGPTNTQPVQVVIPPELIEQYSGGGYLIMQQILIDASGSDFDKLLDENVLKPAGMCYSSFDQSFPESDNNIAAHGHIKGAPVRGNYHRYPEKAAAGLWTTPSDLARWIIALRNSNSGSSPALLDASTVEVMMTPYLGRFGLGVQLEGNDDLARFRHSGTNHGYQADMVGYLHHGKGAVVMTNADTGSMLIREVIHRIADYYDWPGYPQLEQQYYTTLSTDVLENYTGSYRLPQGALLDVVLKNDQLHLQLPGAEAYAMYAAEEDRFFSPFINLNNIVFIRSNGEISEMRIDSGGERIPLEKIDD